MAMNHGCNIRSRNAELQMGKSGILVRHRIKLPHIFAALGRGERRQAVVSTKFSSITLTVIPIGLRFRRASDQSGRLFASMWHQMHPRSDPMLSRRASTVKKPTRHPGEVIETGTSKVS